MGHRRSSLVAVALVGMLAAACSTSHDPMSMLPISEQAFLRTKVVSQPDVQPISVEALLQNALGTGADPATAAVQPPRVVELELGDACGSTLSGKHLIALGHYRSSLEGGVGLAGRIQVPSGEGNLCAFQRAGEIARLLDGTLVDLFIEPTTELAPGRLRVIAEPVA